MIVVTGGAGMIGSNLVKKLNCRGETNILIVDDLTNGKKFINLRSARFHDYLHKTDFIDFLSNNGSSISHVFHFGACSSTTEQNGFYLMKNNYEYSKNILEICKIQNIKLVFASSAAVYGKKTKDFSEISENECPENPYGFSKLAFDNHVRSLSSSKKLKGIVGLRFFNVYGPGEWHKIGMSSPIFSFNQSLTKTQKIRIFKGSHGFGDGGHSRDFVHVDDCVNVALWAAFDFNDFGIFNVGTGISTSFLDVANKIIALRNFSSNDCLEFTKMPKSIAAGYQPYTKADLTNLFAAGFKGKFININEGIENYTNYLNLIA